MNGLVDLSAFDLAIGRNLLSEYFGAWAILSDRFEQLVQRVNQLNIRSHIEQNRADFDPFGTVPGGNANGESEAPYALSQGIAQIEMIGPMMKFASSLSSNVSTVYARKQLRHAANNPDVKAIFLRIDSPGGTVSGTKDIADEVARTKAIKPVVAFVEDLAASAAYWVAAQATEIIANNTTALIGSIGTYAVIYDYSRNAENLGIKTHLITTGKYKGAGVPGVAITPEQLADFQRVIDSLNDQFKSAVAMGRNMATATIDDLADGRVHPATLALDFKLIDRIESFDAAFSRYLNLTTSSSSQPPTRRSSAMSVETKTESHVEPAATLEQLEKVCSEPGFVMDQLKLKATVSQATIAYNNRLKAELEATKANQASEIAKARTEAAEQARSEAEELAKKAAGVKPIVASDDEISDPESGFDDVVATYEEKVEKAKAKLTRLPEDERRQKAVLAVAKSNPQLHQAYLAQCNTHPKLRRLLAEKYVKE